VRKFLRILLGIVLLLIVAVFGVGMLLPETYHAQVQLTLHRSPAEVWAAVSDYQKHPIGGYMRKSTQPQPDVNGLPAWIEDLGDTRLRIETREATPPSFVRRYLKDETVSMDGFWEIRIEPAEGVSRITASSELHVRSGTWHAPIFRVIMSLTSAVRQSLENYWKGIGTSFGETPQFTAP
jgi:hypothetical protein